MESIGLRATALRGPGRERMIVPNGQITGIRVIPGGRRTVRIEMLTRDPDALQAAVTEIAGSMAGAGGPWEGPPRVVLRPAAGDLTRVIAVLETEPARDGDPGGWLVEALAERAGDLVVGRPLAISEGSR